jgi:DNA-binding beta-propeller fold protein YncE
VDGVNSRVVVVDSEGVRKFSFGRKGTGEGEFARPLGIDISDGGKVFIADTGNHRIQVFDLKGNFLSMFPVKSSPGEKPSDPVDVLVSKLKNYLYISDNDNHKIKVYQQNGNFEFEWGKFGESPGQFRYPGILAINEYNEVFVVDVLNTRVQKFDPFGNFVSEIGSWGVLPGKLFRPKGVAVDKSNRVFISDSYMGYVQVFSDLGSFLGIVCENNKNRQFTTPVGMVIDDKNKRLYVVEMRGNNVSVSNLLR